MRYMHRDILHVIKKCNDDALYAPWHIFFMSIEAMSWFYLDLVERNQRHNNFCSFKKVSLSRMFWKKTKKL